MRVRCVALLHAAGPALAGHVAGMAINLLTVMYGLGPERSILLPFAAALVPAALVARLCGCRAATRAGASLAVFVLSAAHGAGMMLAPMLMPFC